MLMIKIIKQELTYLNYTIMKFLFIYHTRTHARTHAHAYIYTGCFILI